MSITITTNNMRRPIREAHELTVKEREEFDYLDWEAIDLGQDSASFFRYKEQLYDLGEFEPTARYHGEIAKNWDGIQSDTYFSGILFRYDRDTMENHDFVIVGRYYSSD